ncbi:MAG: response regulator [Acidobacteria bacterium]|nr:response regulator [Acidobacteriota bacterium]
MPDDKVNILIVDDHPENLLALEALLSDLGQNLVRANSGPEALRHLLNKDFAVILLDVDMPIMNGFETAQLIRQRDRSGHTPIIFLTAVNKAEQHVFHGYSVGAVDYLTKPFVADILRSKVAAFVELYKKTEQVQRQARLLQQVVRELESSNEEIMGLNSELQAERDFIAAVLDTAHSIIVVLDKQQRIIRASRAFEHILGYALDEIKGLPLNVFFKNPEVGVEWSEAEHHWVAKDGSTRLIEWSRKPLTGRSGRADHTVLTGNDITERKRAEAEREQFIRMEAARAEAEAAERRAVFLAEATSMLASTLDYEKTLVNVSRLAIPAFADWCFVFLTRDGGEISSVLVAHTDPEKEKLAQEIEVRPGDLSLDRMPVARVLQTGVPELLSSISEEELRTTVRDEQQFHQINQVGCRSAIIVPIKGRHAVYGVIGFVAVTPGRYGSSEFLFAQELGRRISLALDNARLYREAQEANRAKDEFLATLSHELRTPLNAILGWIQILRAKRLDEVTTSRAFEAIDRNAKSQAQLIEDMLDVSRIITGRLRLDFQAVDLCTAIDGALDTVRPAADAKGVRLECSLEPNCGPISGDQHRLQQIVWNLLSNAVKFTPSGGFVTVKLRRVHTEVRLTVADNGKGISPQFLPYVFDRFRQAETMISRTTSGLGLGLSIARHLVELHGGVIEATSEGEGRGATFTVTFPLRESCVVAATQNAS